MANNKKLENKKRRLNKKTKEIPEMLKVYSTQEVEEKILIDQQYRKTLLK